MYPPPSGTMTPLGARECSRALRGFHDVAVIAPDQPPAVCGTADTVARRSRGGCALDSDRFRGASSCDGYADRPSGVRLCIAPLRPAGEGGASAYRYPLGSDGFRRRRGLGTTARGRDCPVSLPLNRREVLSACGAVGPPPRRSPWRRRPQPAATTSSSAGSSGGPAFRGR